MWLSKRLSEVKVKRELRVLRKKGKECVRIACDLNFWCNQTK